MKCTICNVIFYLTLIIALWLIGEMIYMQLDYKRTPKIKVLNTSDVSLLQINDLQYVEENWKEWSEYSQYCNYTKQECILNTSLSTLLLSLTLRHYDLTNFVCSNMISASEYISIPWRCVFCLGSKKEKCLYGKYFYTREKTVTELNYKIFVPYTNKTFNGRAYQKYEVWTDLMPTPRLIAENQDAIKLKVFQDIVYKQMSLFDVLEDPENLFDRFIHFFF